MKHLIKILSLSSTLGMLAFQTHASLLVYEGFSGYNTGALAGQTATGTGLRGDWALRQNVHTNITSTGLTFGSLVTSGGAATVQVASGGVAANRTSVLGVELDLPSAVSGTLYSSLLFNFSSVGNNSSNLAVMRVSDNIGLQDVNRFNTWPLGQSSATYNPGVSYDNNSATAAQILQTNTTYLAISIFTNVGTTLSSGNPGAASVYVLDLGQFEDFVANGRAESNLISRGTGTGANQVTAFNTMSLTSGTFNFMDGNFVGLATFTQGGTVEGTYDELRWGTSLDSITVIPEPSTLLMIGIAFMGALTLSRRHRRR